KVEVGVVEVEAEVVLLHIGEELAEAGWRRPVRVVFAIHQFLTQRCLDLLVLEVEAREADTDNPQKTSAEGRYDECDPDQTARNVLEAIERRDVRRKAPEDWQEHHKRKEAVEEAGAEVFDNTGEAHRVFLNALGCTFH